MRTRDWPPLGLPFTKTSSKAGGKTSAEICRDEISTYKSRKIVTYVTEQQKDILRNARTKKSTCHSLFLKVPSECSL